MTRSTCLGLLLGLAVSLPALAQDADPKPPKPRPLVLRATGLGKHAADASGRAKLMARRAAKLDALRKLVAAINGMVTDADGTTWTQGVIQGFEVVEEKALADGTGYQVTVELPLSKIATNFHMLHGRSAKLKAELDAARKEIVMLKAKVGSLQERLAKTSAALDALTARYDALIAGLRKLIPAEK